VMHCLQGVLKVQHIWVPVFSANGVEVSYRQLADSYIPLWRVTAEIEAPPNEILSRIISDRCTAKDIILRLTD
jgi:hypothetical protein